MLGVPIQWNLRCGRRMSGRTMLRRDCLFLHDIGCDVLTKDKYGRRIGGTRHVDLLEGSCLKLIQLASTVERHIGSDDTVETAVAGLCSASFTSEHDATFDIFDENEHLPAHGGNDAGELRLGPNSWQSV